jgi:cellulose synthase (UDP-forming)
VFNLILLLAALLVAFEQPQLRRTHRLPRHLPATIYSADKSWSGTTVNVSETGVLIALDTWPNLPDEVEIELVGDYGARAFLDGRIIRGTPINESQTHLAIEFVNLTQAQLDSLSLVIYSDVKEWYSQSRDYVDRPLESFRFLATGLARSFQEFQADGGRRVRKRIRVPAQIYWEGNFYLGEASELGTTSIRLELDGSTTSNSKTLQDDDLERMQQDRPLIGLLLSQETANESPKRFLAQIQAIELLSPQQDNDTTRRRVAVELNFPEQFKQQQADKIKQLLKVL